jgi:hypothetical protein
MSTGFQPTSPRTQIDITIAVVISRNALMIWTHEVASIPPATM